MTHGLLRMPAALVPASSESAPARWFVADGSSGRLRLADLSAGTIATVAGYPFGTQPGDGVPARFSDIGMPVGAAVDPQTGALFLSDLIAGSIFRIDPTVTPYTATIVADAGPGFIDGPGATAQFLGPVGLAFEPRSRRLLVADSGNHVVRSIDVDSPEMRVQTIAGQPGQRGKAGDAGPAHLSQLNGPQGVASGPDGSIYIADTGNDLIRRIDPHGQISSVQPIASPFGLAFDPNGNLLVTSRGQVVLLRAMDGSITRASPATVIFGEAPTTAFPAAAAACLSGLAIGDSPSGGRGGRVFVLDACAGLWIELDRRRL